MFTTFLPLSIPWFKPDRGEAVNIIGQVFEVSTVSVANTDTCIFSQTLQCMKQLMQCFELNNQIFVGLNLSAFYLEQP